MRCGEKKWIAVLKQAVAMGKGSAPVILVLSFHFP